MAQTNLSEAGIKALEETIVVLKELDITQQNEFVLTIVKEITSHRFKRFLELKNHYGEEIDNYEKRNEELLRGLETTVKENLDTKQ